MRFLILGNPENRRVSFFIGACKEEGLAEPVVLAWQDYLLRPDLLSTKLQQCDALRIESPGENFTVEKALILRGGGPHFNESHGRVRFLPEWYRGWSDVMEKIEATVGTQLPFMNSPSDIKLMFDKWMSQQALASAGVPTPQLLGQISNFDELMAMMETSSVNRIFVKPRHSSSASGVVAFQISNHRMQAVSSLDLIQGQEIKLYNSLRLRTYTEENDCRCLFNTIGSQKVFVERWFPKASIRGRNFDLRILSVAGKACHVVVRTSRSPITNLHLGNRRGDWNEVQKRLGSDMLMDIMQCAEKASRSFPNSHYVAVDLMLEIGLRHYAVAEVNAFGDLLPNVLHNKLSTYQWEIREFIANS